MNTNTKDSELKCSNKYIDDINFFDDENDNDVNIFASQSDLLVLDNVLSPKECDSIVEYFESDGFERYKKSDRYKNICNMPALTNVIAKRCNNYIAKQYNDKYTWNFNNINECWRCVKCEPSSSLSSHFDATSVKSINEMSKYTVMMYLSDNEDGATYYNQYNLRVYPVKGRCVLFDLKLQHNGEKNSKVKYILRSELYYTREQKIPSDDSNYICYELYHQALLDENEEIEGKALKDSEMLSEMVYNF